MLIPPPTPSLSLQDDHLSGCAGVHLCHLRHVLCPCQLCGLPHPGEGEQGQAHAVHQRSAASPLLAGQLRLGYGKWTGSSLKREVKNMSEARNYLAKCFYLLLWGNWYFWHWQSVKMNKICLLKFDFDLNVHSFLCCSATTLSRHLSSSSSSCASNKRPMCQLPTSLFSHCCCSFMGRLHSLYTDTKYLLETQHSIMPLLS